MIPEYPKLKPVEIRDKSLIAGHLNKDPKNICELALANLFIWADFDRPEATIINGNLCIMINPMNEAPYFLEPVGKTRLKETAQICLSHTGTISRASHAFVCALKESPCAISPQRNQFDYVYSTKELAELKGKKFDGKRNHIKKFRLHNQEYAFSPLSIKMGGEALELFEKWFEVRKESRFFPRLAHKYQRAALEIALSNMDELDLKGGALFSGKKMLGFMMGSKLNQETACVHFSFGDPAIQGTSQMLLLEGANRLFPEFRLTNLEQDLGIPGLRTAKLSYHPLRLEEKFHVECIK